MMLQLLLPSIYDMMLDKEPIFFWGRKGVEPTMKPKVSQISVSKGAGVPGATGPHSLLTAGLVAVGAASLPLTILSLTTLPCHACDDLGQTRPSASS